MSPGRAAPSSKEKTTGVKSNSAKKKREEKREKQSLPPSGTFSTFNRAKENSCAQLLKSAKDGSINRRMF